MTKSLKEAICKAIEQYSIEGGHMSFDCFKTMFDSHSTDLLVICILWCFSIYHVKVFT